jgi:hypothetical protein
VAAKKAALAAQLVRGERVVLYESVYLPVDSVLPEGEEPGRFDIRSLKRAGLRGWDDSGITSPTAGAMPEMIGAPRRGGGVGRSAMLSATLDPLGRAMLLVVDSGIE